MNKLRKRAIAKAVGMVYFKKGNRYFTKAGFAIVEHKVPSDKEAYLYFINEWKHVSKGYKQIKQGRRRSQ